MTPFQYLSKVSGDGQSRENVRRSRYKTDRSTLNTGSLPSAKVNGWEIAVGQAVKVPSPEMFVLGGQDEHLITMLRACPLTAPYAASCQPNCNSHFRSTKYFRITSVPLLCYFCYCYIVDVNVHIHVQFHVTSSRKYQGTYVNE